MVGERVAIMNILDLKRQLLALRGYLAENARTDGGMSGSGPGGYGSDNRSRGYGGGSGGGFGMFGPSYANPDDKQMTNLPDSGLTPAQKAEAARQVADHPNGLSTDAGPSWAAQNPIMQKVASFFAGLFGGAVAGPVGGMALRTVEEKIANAPGLSDSEKAEARIALAGMDKSGAFNPTSGGSNKFTEYFSPGGAGASGAAQTPEEAAAAANKDPATLATSIANQSWNDWQGDKKALQGQVATNTARGNALYDSSMAAANGNMKLVTGMQDDYNNIYRPAGQQFANYVNMLGSKEYQDQQAGRATADVQQQADAQMNAAQRNLQRSGVNPNSGRMLSMANQNAIGTAAAQAGAANTSRRNTLSDWSTGLTKMADMGNATLNSAKGLDSSAQSWKTLGLNAGNTGFNQSSDLSKLSALNTSTSGGVAGTAANAIYNQGQLANSNAANQRANDAANPWTTIGGAIVTEAAKGIDWGSLFETT